jgi:hypothetical protein
MTMCMLVDMLKHHALDFYYSTCVSPLLMLVLYFNHVLTATNPMPAIFTGFPFLVLNNNMKGKVKCRESLCIILS